MSLGIALGGALASGCTTEVERYATQSLPDAAECPDEPRDLPDNAEDLEVSRTVSEGNVCVYLQRRGSPARNHGAQRTWNEALATLEAEANAARASYFPDRKPSDLPGTFPFSETFTAAGHSYLVFDGGQRSCPAFAQDLAAADWRATDAAELAAQIPRPKVTICGYLYQVRVEQRLGTFPIGPR